MPNRPLVKQPIFVPLYAGLSTEVVDKLVQPQNGVLEMENMVCALTGEISKRVGSANLATPSTPTLPAGGSLPTLYELAGYRDQLVRLSVMGQAPIWPFASGEQSWLLPAPPAAEGVTTSLFRGPISVALSPLVGAVTVGTNVQTPSSCTAGSVILSCHEVFAEDAQANVGIVEIVSDALTLKPLTDESRAQGFRPRCIAVGQFMLVFFMSLFDGTVRVDLYDSASIASGAGQIILTSAGTINSASLLAVTLKNGTTATVAYTDTTGTVQAIDLVASTQIPTAYALHTAAAATFSATAAMSWVQDLGASGKLSLVTQDATNGVVVHWDFGAISGSVSTAAVEYVADASFVGESIGTTVSAGVWSVSAYTTSASATGEFVAMYDYLATADTAASVVYRSTRVGSTLTPGAPYWYGASLVSEFWQPGDGGTYALTSFSNSASPATPQNTYFVCVDGTTQPVPQATAMPQSAGGVSRRSSSLVNVSSLFGARLLAVSALVDLQFVNGIPTQVLGASLLQIKPLPQQDTSTSAPIEAFGSLLVPGGTLMAYDGRTYGEAVFANRPEPPKLIATNPSSLSPTSITHSSGDRLIGAAQQQIAATPGDLVSTPSAGYTIPHQTGDHVTVGGGNATYVFTNPGNFSPNVMDPTGIIVGGTLAVSGSGTAGNNVTGTVTGVTQDQFHGTTSIIMTATSQSAAALGGGTVAVATSTNPNRFYLKASGLGIVTNDPTFANQLFVVSGGTQGGTVNPNIGTFTLDGTTPCGTQTLPNGQTYFFFQVTGSPTVAAWQYNHALPSIVLTLADPTTANTWTIGNASFNGTYVGGRLQAVNTLNPVNSSVVTILQVLSATKIVTSAPISGPLVGLSFLRNEDLGATTAITYTATATNAIPNGSHAYVALYSRVDANGRKWRSPPSLPSVVNTTTAFPGVSATIQALNFTGQSCNVELYRAQTNVGGQYNLVSTASNDPTIASVSIADNFSDDIIAEQEELFSDGGVLPGTPIGSVSLIAVHQGRVVIVSPESPQSLFYSNPDDSGSGGGGDGLLFDTTNLSLDIIDSHGGINAIRSMDSSLVTLKGDAVYAVAGAGPDGTGQNGAYQASLIASGVGTSNPRSVVLQVGTGTAPGGVWFQSEATRAGIFTVTRGLTVEYTGAGVRRYTSETIVASLVYPALTQLRWYTASGRTLCYDWTSKLWGTNTGQPALSAILLNGLPVVAASDTFTGYVLEETPGLYEDGELSGVYTPYVQKVASAWLSVGGLKGYQRTYRIQGVGKAIGDHTLTAQLYADFDDTNLIGTASKAFTAGDDWDWELLPAVQKVDAIKVVLTGADPAGAPTGTAGFSVTGLTLLVGVKKGLSKLPDASRLT